MKNRLIPILIVVLFLTGCWPFGDEPGASSQQTAVAVKETLTITTTEDGTVEAEEKVLISNELKWPVIIKSVVKEGTVVQEGELIIEFECKALEDAIDQKELHLNGAELGLEQAQKDLLIARKQHTINLEQAKNALQDAEENLTLYLDQSQSNLSAMEETVRRYQEALERYNEEGGQKENALRNAEIAITMGRKRLRIAQDKLEFKRQVNENPKLNKPYSESEIESDEVNVETLKNTLDDNIAAKELLIKYDIPQMSRQLVEDVNQAEKDLEILKTHTIVQTLRQKKTAVKEAQLNLERAELAQEAELKWKQQEIKAKEKELQEHQEQMEKLREDEQKLRVTAERAGLVLYTPGWKGEGMRLMVKEGEEIYPRGQLMQIPDMTTLRVKTMLFEALREYVTVAGGSQEHKLVEGEVEAYIAETFKALMTRVATGALPKEDFAAEAIKIKTEGYIPRIRQAVRDGRMTKDQAKTFHARLQEQETQLAAQTGGTPHPVAIDWDDLPDIAPSRAEDRPGTQALVVLDAFAQRKQLVGRVVESSPLPKSTGPEWLQTGTKAYDLFVALDWEAQGLVPGENLRPGMGGKVTLLLDEIEDALTIPVLSVFNKKDRYFCMKIENGIPAETEITLGKMNESRVQVLSGLFEGDQVLLVAQSDEGIDGDSSVDEEGASSGDMAGEGAN
jgi:multidrug efflux pump subunit AcrA (membrane-fusion protein)